MPNTTRHSVGNLRSDMDITYPQHLSRLNRHLVLEYIKPVCRDRRQNRNRSRYRTQPITFYEIQEVDEENFAQLEKEDNGKEPTSPIAGNLQKKFLHDFMKLKLLASKRKSSRGSVVKSASNEELNVTNGEQSVDVNGEDEHVPFGDGNKKVETGEPEGEEQPKQEEKGEGKQLK